MRYIFAVATLHNTSQKGIELPPRCMFEVVSEEWDRAYSSKTRYYLTFLE
jgi:Uma2 family endonuclease